MPRLIARIPTIGRYLTAETITLGCSGFVAGLLASLIWRVVGRARWGAAPFMVAAVAAAGVTGRSDWPRWSWMVPAGAIVTILAGAGAARLLADPAVHWAWVAAGAIISVGGVWAGVPETGPALLAAGGFVGLATGAALTRSRWTPAAGMGAAAVLGWAALSGAGSDPWAVVGGALCTGVAPWFALSSQLPWRRSWSPSPWLLGAHVALVIVAARWIGVDPHAGWRRVAVVAFGGIVVSMTTRRQA